MIAAGAVGHFYKEGPDNDYEKKDRIQFFLVAVGIAAVVVIAFFIIFLTGIHKKVKILWTKTVIQLEVHSGVTMLSRAPGINK